MMNFTIRPATNADCKDIWRLLRDLSIHEKMLDQMILTCEELQRDGFSQNPLFECLVAEVPDENKSKEGFTIVGYGLYFYTYSTWKGRSMYLENLYVMPEFRGFGIGKGLLRNVAKVAKEKQCLQLELNVLDWNTPSLDFYARRGARDLTVTEGCYSTWKGRSLYLEDLYVMPDFRELERDAFRQTPWFESLLAEVPEENKSKEGFKTVGLAVYFYSYSTWKGRTVYLEDLYVMPEFRGFGIGNNLLSTLAKLAKEKQCVQLELNVLGQNSRSRSFYVAKGAEDVTVRDDWHTVRFDAQSLDNLIS